MGLDQSRRVGLFVLHQMVTTSLALISDQRLPATGLPGAPPG